VAVKNNNIVWSINRFENNCFQFEYISKCNLFLWWHTWIFSIITPVFGVTWSFRNHSNVFQDSLFKRTAFIWNSNYYLFKI